MPQLHFYVPDKVAARVKQIADSAGLSVSQYLAGVVKKELHAEWPSDFFDTVVGGWQGEPLARGEQGTYDVRETFELGEN